MLRAAGDSGRIGNAPMGGYGLSGPDGADFTSGVVANGKDKIHWRGARLGEFVPALAAQIGRGEFGRFELLERERIDAAGGKAAGAVSGEIGLAFLVEDGFGHDGTGRIAGAEKEDVAVHVVVSVQID